MKKTNKYIIILFFIHLQGSDENPCSSVHQRQRGIRWSEKQRNSKRLGNRR